MSKKSEILKAGARTQVGSRNARWLRAEGRIPASLDKDDKHDHADIHIEEHGFLATRRRHTHLYEVEVDGQKGLQMAVVRELQWDTFGERIVHIDFKRVQRDVKTNSEVELEYTGVPKGGILNHLITHVTVRCIPMLIPDSIEVPVGHLELGNAVYLKDLKLPEGVEIVGKADQKIAVVVMAARMEAAPAAAEGDAAAAAGGTVAAPAKPAAGAAAKPAAAPAKPAKG
ncbi:MAG: 50S ribosomal protein L25 [Planctomycetota bacterium]|nr:50S ribosomal protein L25 [Planctomycetota bacterium]